MTNISPNKLQLKYYVKTYDNLRVLLGYAIYMIQKMGTPLHGSCANPERVTMERKGFDLNVQFVRER